MTVTYNGVGFCGELPAVTTTPTSTPVGESVTITWVFDRGTGKWTYYGQHYPPPDDDVRPDHTVG